VPAADKSAAGAGLSGTLALLPRLCYNGEKAEQKEEAMYRILIVEDDRGIAGAIREQAALWELECRCVTDFRHVLSEFAAFSPHLVLMDISLPFFDGYHWCREIREVSKVPVIFISSAGDNMNIVMAMNMGADDFIVKPFDQSVLMAKIQAMLRRTYDFADAVPVLEHRGAVLNPGDGTLTYRGEKVPLTKNEQRILLALLRSKGRTVSRERLMEQLWESDSFVDDNTLTVNVNRLRKKLAAAGLEEFITTRVGEGYLIG
jgi:DNA-binding response OmpR family regulator